MSDHPSKNGTAQVAEFPVSDEEKARRLLVEVERLARPSISASEREYLIEKRGYAEKYGVDRTTFRRMLEAAVKENQKKAQEDRGELRRAEKQRDTARREDERKQERKERAEERKREREEREARKEAEKKEREKQKAFAAIVKLPSAEHESRLATLARQLGEDLDVLREEFAELRIEEEERIKRGQVEPWDEPVNARELLAAAAGEFGKKIIISNRGSAP